MDMSRPLSGPSVKCQDQGPSFKCQVDVSRPPSSLSVKCQVDVSSGHVKAVVKAKCQVDERRNGNHIYKGWDKSSEAESSQDQV